MRMFYVVGHLAVHLAHQESLTLKQKETKPWIQRLC